MAQNYSQSEVHEVSQLAGLQDTCRGFFLTHYSKTAANARDEAKEQAAQHVATCPDCIEAGQSWE
ncbi:MAG TPA: hypothetical protein VLI05_01205 [Candidatus Saccharimonadia bacterium]|nr:hypothetical protein [Candidatus Saccharimonadia bacterium]